MAKEYLTNLRSFKEEGPVPQLAVTLGEQGLSSKRRNFSSPAVRRGEFLDNRGN